MPKTKRDLLKRQIAHAYNNITLAVEHLAMVEAPFHDVHPELAEAIQVSIVGLTEVKHVLEQFIKAAWGSLPADFETWRNVGDK
jgi:hypothetical protein